MSANAGAQAPGLGSYLKSLKHNSVDSSIEQLISLLKRRQIRGSRPCAIATTQLFLRVVNACKHHDAPGLMARIRHVGQRLVTAQPREMVIGNIVRRVLGLVREIVDEEAESNADEVRGASPDGLRSQGPEAVKRRPILSSSISTFSPLRHGVTQPAKPVAQFDGRPTTPDRTGRPPLLQTGTSYAPAATSLFGLFSGPDMASGTSTPLSGFGTPRAGFSPRFEDRRGSLKDIRPEVLEGIREILDEIDQVDDQIASYALEHIHSSEIILTHTSSLTVQKFLLTAAKKRQFTVIHVEGYPNDSAATRSTLLHGATAPSTDDSDEAQDRWKPLTSAGITVIMIPDSAVYALMSRVNKVLLATHSVLANGGLVAAAGAQTIALAAKMHRTPVIVLSGVYKLSPIYPFDTDQYIEWGDASAVIPFSEGEFVDKVEVNNPLFDYVPPELVGLYITNLGGHAPSFLYRIVADHYHPEDTELEA